MRLKRKESKLCHGPDANCSMKFSVPVLRSVTQCKALFISAWWRPVYTTAPTSRAVFVGNVRKSVLGEIKPLSCRRSCQPSFPACQSKSFLKSAAWNEENLAFVHVCMVQTVRAERLTLIILSTMGGSGWEWQSTASDGCYLLYIHKFLFFAFVFQAWPPFLLPLAPRGGEEGQAHRTGTSESFAFSGFLVSVTGSTKAAHTCLVIWQISHSGELLEQLMGHRSSYMQVLPFPAKLNPAIPKFTYPSANPLLPLLLQLTCWVIIFVFSIHILKLLL